MVPSWEELQGLDQVDDEDEDLHVGENLRHTVTGSDTKCNHSLCAVEPDIER